MTTSILNRTQLEERLILSGKEVKISELKFVAAPTNPVPLTGKALIARAKGLFTKDEVDSLERHITESCEQLDD